MTCGARRSWTYFRERDAAWNRVEDRELSTKRGGVAWTARLPVARPWPVQARIRSRAAYLADAVSARAGLRAKSGAFSERFNCTPYAWSGA